MRSSCFVLLDLLLSERIRHAILLCFGVVGMRTSGLARPVSSIAAVDLYPIIASIEPQVSFCYAKIIENLHGSHS